MLEVEEDLYIITERKVTLDSESETNGPVAPDMQYSPTTQKNEAYRDVQSEKACRAINQSWSMKRWAQPLKYYTNLVCKKIL